MQLDFKLIPNMPHEEDAFVYEEMEEKMPGGKANAGADKDEDDDIEKQDEIKSITSNRKIEWI